MKEIKINNNVYTVYFLEEDDGRLLMDDNEYHSGMTDFIKKEIYINKDLNIYSLKYTLLHELTHAVIDSLGLLQIDWNNEIVADFIANNFTTIGNLFNEIMLERYEK